MRAGASANGGLEVNLMGGPVALIAEYLFELVRGGKKTGAPSNYVESELLPSAEMRVGHRSGERYVLTVQRVHGLTPNEKERAAIKRAEAAEASVAALRTAIRPFAEHGFVEDTAYRDLLPDLMRDRIVDWFGPSDFEKARAAYAEAPADA